MSDKKIKDTGFALACWILVALILLVFFFVKKDTIVSNLRHTNFVNRVMGKAGNEDAAGEAQENTGSVTSAEGQLPPAGQVPSPNGDGGYGDDISIAEGNASSEGNNASGGINGIAENADGGIADGANKNSAKTKTDEASILVPPSGEKTSSMPEAAAEEKENDDVRPMKKPVIEEERVMPAAEKSDAATMKVKLCFVVIDSDGTVSRRISERALPKTLSPLTASINALLAGPADGSETLIPEGTRLLGAEVRGGLATLNFSEEFAFNPVGVEGYMAQLMQVVYTATSFSTVNSVQIVINGQHVDYLGSEGEWIGSPLTRASFR